MNVVALGQGAFNLDQLALEADLKGAHIPRLTLVGLAVLDEQDVAVGQGLYDVR